jgi:hypothetical protein
MVGSWVAIHNYLRASYVHYFYISQEKQCFLGRIYAPPPPKNVVRSFVNIKPEKASPSTNTLAYYVSPLVRKKRVNLF